MWSANTPRSSTAWIDNARQRALIIAAALDKGRAVQPLPASGAGDDAARVIDSRGRVVAASANVAGEPALCRVGGAGPCP
ncbi:hypothetical protein GCM10009574_066890 [Streptomyces asiaticus]|uniref:Uncharacterized protein n=1 Tax=Streptomyces rhizosphaericus TaxID=114699 RepID=A0ABN1SC99_9ACTN